MDQCRHQCVLQKNNSWATQLSRDKQSDIPFLCQNLAEAVFSLLDASFSNRHFGPLTIGVVLGVSIGLAVAAFGLYVLDAGGSDNEYDSILVVALCAATIGFLLGFAAELLPSHPKLAGRPWIRYVIRPISFCSLKGIAHANSIRDFRNLPATAESYQAQFCRSRTPGTKLLLPQIRHQRGLTPLLSPTTKIRIPAQAHPTWFVESSRSKGLGRAG